MKKLLLVAYLPLLAACTENHYYTVRPQPTTRVEHVYHKQTSYRSSAPRKSSPSVSSESAEEFRAVEKPGSYSQ